MQGGCVFARVGPVVALANAIPALVPRAGSRAVVVKSPTVAFQLRAWRVFHWFGVWLVLGQKRQSQCKNRRFHYTAPVAGGLQIRPGHQDFPTLELPSIDARLQGRRPDRYIAVPAQEHLRTGRQCWVY